MAIIISRPFSFGGCTSCFNHTHLLNFQATPATSMLSTKETRTHVGILPAIEMCVMFRVTERCSKCHTNTNLRTVLRRCDAAMCDHVDESVTSKEIICLACTNEQRAANILAVADICLIKRLVDKECALVDRLKMLMSPEKSGLEIMRSLEFGEGVRVYEEMLALQRDIDALLEGCEWREGRE